VDEALNRFLTSPYVIIWALLFGFVTSVVFSKVSRRSGFSQLGYLYVSVVLFGAYKFDSFFLLSAADLIGRLIRMGGLFVVIFFIVYIFVRLGRKNA